MIPALAQEAEFALPSVPPPWNADAISIDDGILTASIKIFSEIAFRHISST